MFISTICGVVNIESHIYSIIDVELNGIICYIQKGRWFGTEDRKVGRCEFQGCNKLLYEHSISKEYGNYAENAHVEAVSPGGARY